jgi:hypothetical protein
MMMDLTTRTQGGQKHIAVESETEEYLEVASQNHALIQLRLGSQLLNLDDKFNAATESCVFSYHPLCKVNY